MGAEKIAAAFVVIFVLVGEGMLVARHQVGIAAVVAIVFGVACLMFYASKAQRDRT